MKQISHHPIFREFPSTPCRFEGAFCINHIGARSRRKFDVNVGAGSKVSDATPSSIREPKTFHFPPLDNQLPPFDEEYFEWIDVLEAVKASSSKFVMIELGAGYGRWMANAVAALRHIRPNSNLFLVGVEAEPTHYKWLFQNLRDNDIDPRKHLMINAAVSARSEPVYFWTGDPDAWYGQAIADEDYVSELRRNWIAQWRNNAYVGKPGLLDRLWRRHKHFIRKVKCVRLSEILSKVDDIVDIIDIDVQGTEFEVIAESKAVLSERVKRLHIGTHSQEIEEKLRALLPGLGWELTQDYGCLGERQTPYGDVTFEDGVQSWINRRWLDHGAAVCADGSQQTRDRYGACNGPTGLTISKSPLVV